MKTTPGIYEIALRMKRYSLSIPKNYQAEQPTPLILALHYAGHGIPYYGKPMITELVGPAFLELNAIIAAPDCTAADWTQAQSVTDVLELLDHIESEYHIDPQKRLITGYSMGGMGTWHLAANHPERFNAAIIMAGLPPQNAHKVDWKIPLFVLHSRQDELMPIKPTQKKSLSSKIRGSTSSYTHSRG